MTLIINTTTPEGIVIAADSRQSYRNRKGISRVGSDTAQKLFKVNQRVGIAISGLAYIVRNGIMKNVSTVIDDFIETSENDDLSVEDITKNLYDAFKEAYNVDEQFANIETKIRQDLSKEDCKNLTFEKANNTLTFKFEDSKGNKKNGNANIEQINFLVAGFNKDKSHEVYSCYLPGEIKQNRSSAKKGMEYGASWLGQTDLVARIILGYDPRIGKLPTIRKINEPNFSQELRGLEYSIQWGTMTLQDGVDFSDLMIKTTSAIQRFSDGIALEPGDMPGVGGDVDIAVITKKHGFKWINKKSIIYQDSKITFD